MSNRSLPEIDSTAPPFNELGAIRHLASERSGHASFEHVRHQLYAARDKRTRGQVLVKVTSKPGLVYERNLANEIASLTMINRELPDSRYFPVVRDSGRFPDGRLYVTSTLFDEFPLATTIGPERIPGRMVAHLRASIETTRALVALHGVGIVHVDLNPMNILYRVEQGKPVIRLVDFESSYERSRHAAGEFYDPPTTPGYAAPEVGHRAPDARADVYSMGAVVYTQLAGYQWTWGTTITDAVRSDAELDPELHAILLRAVDPKPDTRYGSMADLQAALGAYLEQIWPGRAW